MIPQFPARSDLSFRMRLEVAIKTPEPCLAKHVYRRFQKQRAVNAPEKAPQHFPTLQDFFTSRISFLRSWAFMSFMACTIP